MTEDREHSGKRHVAETGHQLALSSRTYSNCAECDWSSDSEAPVTEDREPQEIHALRVIHAIAEAALKADPTGNWLNVESIARHAIRDAGEAPVTEDREAVDHEHCPCGCGAHMGCFIYGESEAPVTEDRDALKEECEVMLSIPQEQRSVQHGDAFYEAVLKLIKESNDSA